MSDPFLEAVAWARSAVETKLNRHKSWTRHDATAIRYWALCSSSDGVVVQAVSLGASNGGFQRHNKNMQRGLPMVSKIK